MNDPKFQQHGGPHRSEHPHGPRWKRMHHSPFFWVAAFFIMVAMVIYVMSNNLSVGRGGKQIQGMPAISP